MGLSVNAAVGSMRKPAGELRNCSRNRISAEKEEKSEMFLFTANDIDWSFERLQDESNKKINYMDS